MDDLYELKLETERTKEEIINYVTVIETFYTEKLNRFKTSMMKLKKRNGFKTQ